MSNTGLSVCISEDDSNVERNDTHVLYHKLLKHYKKKTKKIKKLEDDTKLITENVIFYFIKKEIEEDRDVTDDTIFDYMINEYKDRFSANTEADKKCGWCGTYKFNYGDLVFDTTEDQKCIVLREDKVHVWLWYFNNTSTNELISKKQKMDSSIMSLRKCNINEECNNMS